MSSRMDTMDTWMRWQNRLFVLLITVLAVLAVCREESTAGPGQHPLITAIQKTTPHLTVLTWHCDSHVKIKHPRYNKRFQKSDFLELGFSVEKPFVECASSTTAGVLLSLFPKDHISHITSRGPPVTVLLS